LNLNPTFVPVQAVSNTPLAVFAMKGHVERLITGQLWYRKLDPDSREVVDEYLGVSAGHAANETPRYGAAADNGLVRFYRALADSDRAQKLKGSRLNFMQWNPRMDDAQNSFFRRAVFYDEARRQARSNMEKNMRSVIGDAKPLIEILAMAPGPKKMEALRAAEPQIERVALHVDDFLGNYLRYTARERQYLKTSLLFYGFLRWSVKFTFYTLPVKHPVATALLTKLGELHNEEVIDLLSLQAVNESGGKIKRGDAEAVLRAGGFTNAFGRIWLTHDGELSSIDLGRVNPFLGPITEFFNHPLKQLPGMLSPVLQSIADLSYGKSSFLGRTLNVKGKVTKAGTNPDIGPGEAVRYVTRNVGNSIFPVRFADNIINPGQQGDDSLPILGDRPILPTSPGQAAKAKTQLEAKGSKGERAKQMLLPLVVPKPDTTSRSVASRASAEKLQQITDRLSAMERANEKFIPGTRYLTPEYEALDKQRKKYQPARAKVVRPLKTPLTPGGELKRQIEEFHKQRADPQKALQDEIAAFKARRKALAAQAGR
jgi:hypothetical protein